AEDAGRERLRRGDRPAALLEASAQGFDVLEEAGADRRRLHGGEEVERRAERREVRRRQNARLVSPRTGAERGAAVPEGLAPRLEVPPPVRAGRDPLPRGLVDEEDPAARRAVQPLVAVGAEHVDLRRLHVDRQRAEALDPVDDEEDPALAAERADL